jgi:hypothetical protein
MSIAQCLGRERPAAHPIDDDLSQFITLRAATHHLIFHTPPAFIETFAKSLEEIAESVLVFT